VRRSPAAGGNAAAAGLRRTVLRRRCKAVPHTGPRLRSATGPIPPDGPPATAPTGIAEGAVAVHLLRRGPDEPRGRRWRGAPGAAAGAADPAPGRGRPGPELAPPGADATGLAPPGADA